MDKKKVKELIEHSILHIDRVKMVNIKGFEALVDAKRMLESALEELSKSDWISVENRLPPYYETTNVRMESKHDVYYSTSKRVKSMGQDRNIDYDKNDFDLYG